MDRRYFFKQVLRLGVLAGMFGIGVRVVRRGGVVSSGGCGGCPVFDSCGFRPLAGDLKNCGRAEKQLALEDRP